ncbi:MAG: polyketide synthase dehydratase domain-containing protein [Candidatus Riflebacteria bacterium]|nr:polyketide synthase dehydratase domain-containing protein [Candidatus Riflebacteria bacterium]
MPTAPAATTAPIIITTTRRLFSLETIPWLQDHVIDGTPFVPLAALAEELLATTPPFPPECDLRAVRDFVLEQPVMLRRNRPKELFPSVAGHEICFRNSTGETMFRGTPDLPLEKPLPRPFQEEEKTISAISAQHLCQPVILPLSTVLPMAVSTALAASLSKTLSSALSAAVSSSFSMTLSVIELYPALFFHGPTFQADISVLSLRPDRMYVKRRISPAPPLEAPSHLDESARRAIVAADLALQSAALLAMTKSETGVAPWSCRAYARRKMFPKTSVIVIYACVTGDGSHDIDVHGEDGEFLLACRGLVFKPMQRSLSEPALVILKKIKNNFPGYSAEIHESTVGQISDNIIRRTAGPRYHAPEHTQIPISTVGANDHSPAASINQPSTNVCPSVDTAEALYEPPPRRQ